ncbi:MAG: TIGR03792 family protein, partial [Synechococcus sp. BS30m-G31]|nr:TIGR03792 family protein [Synechococcus sp. BS30m-G31]
MIRTFVLLFAILVLFAGQALASEAVIEQLRLKVPESQVQIWLEAEQQTWQPWLEQQKGFLGRDIAWDPAHEEGQLLIHWATRDQWKAISSEEVDVVQ